MGYCKNEAVNILNNSVLKDKRVLEMVLVQIKHLLKYLKKVHLEKLILEIFSLVLIENGIGSHGKNLMS